MHRCRPVAGSARIQSAYDGASDSKRRGSPSRILEARSNVRVVVLEDHDRLGALPVALAGDQSGIEASISPLLSCARHADHLLCPLTRSRTSARHCRSARATRQCSAPCRRYSGTRRKFPISPAVVCVRLEFDGYWPEAGLGKPELPLRFADTSGAEVQKSRTSGSLVPDWNANKTAMIASFTIRTAASG